MKSTRKRRWSRVVWARAGARPEARMPARPAPALVSHRLRSIMSVPPGEAALARGRLRADLLEELAHARIVRRVGRELLGERERALPLAALRVEHGDGVGDVPVAGMELEGREDGRLRFAVGGRAIRGGGAMVW